MSDPVKITGLREFVRGLKAMDRDIGKFVRLAFNEAADIVVDDARPRIPKKSGKAAGSVKARSTQTAARIIGGGRKAPHYPWLDFGGRVGKGRSVRRPFLKDGRYIYASYDRRKAEFIEAMQDALVKVASDAGIEVT